MTAVAYWLGADSLCNVYVYTGTFSRIVLYYLHQMIIYEFIPMPILIDPHAY